MRNDEQFMNLTNNYLGEGLRRSEDGFLSQIEAYLYGASKSYKFRTITPNSIVQSNTLLTQYGISGRKARFGSRRSVVSSAMRFMRAYVS